MTHAPDPYLGRVLKETYRLDKLLGRGGMGAVYEASHLRLPKRFAVKVLVRPTDADPGLKDRFLREAEICSRIEHDNVVDIVDFDETPEGALYMVMELLAGEDLAVRLARERRQDASFVFWLFDALCGAVQAAHRLNVVHRDLKPANIFLHRKGGRQSVKVLDFGIAKLRTDASGLTVSGTLVGTPFYMAPEQIEGRTVDARSDVFALGAILYEVVTGTVAFSGSSLAKVAHLIVYEKRPELPQDHPLVDVLGPVLGRCLAVAPGDRYQSVAELWNELKRALEPVVDPQQVALWSEVSGDVGDLSLETAGSVAEAPTVAADPATGGRVAAGPAGSTASVRTGPEGDQAEAEELDVKSFSTLTILAQKKAWIAGAGAVFIGVVLLFLLLRYGDGARRGNKPGHRAGLKVSAKILLGKEIDETLSRFGDPNAHFLLTKEQWAGCAGALERLLSKRRGAWLEAAHHLAASRVLLWKQRPGEAERRALAAVSLKENWVLGWVNLAWVRLWLGRVALAERAAAQAMSLVASLSAARASNPDDLDSRFATGQWSGLGRAETVAAAVHLVQGRVDKAYYGAEKAVRAAPGDPAAWAVRSAAAELKGHREEAELWAFRALAKGPVYGPAVNRVAELALASGEPELARRLCAAGAKSLAALWRPLMLRCTVRACAKAGRFEDAAGALRELEESLKEADAPLARRVNVELEKVRVQVLQWLASGAQKTALEAFEGLTRAYKDLHLDAVQSRTGADILELMCAISLEVDTAGAARVCRRAVSHALAGPTAKALNAMAELERGSLSSALSSFRDAKAGAEAMGFDVRDLELRVNLLEQRLRSRDGAVRTGSKAWLVRRAGPVPFRLYRPELL